MEDSSIPGKRCTRLAWALAAIGCILVAAPAYAHAQQSSAVVETPETISDEPYAPGSEAERESQRMHEAIGGGEPVRGMYYTSPLKKFGTDLFFASYAIGAVASIAYLGGVYPVQALFGSSKLEPVMLWMLLPVAGPWFAQYEDSVRSKLFWRVVLIGDAALQASGVVLGLIGMALSGRRKLEPTSSSGVEWKLGVAGPGLAGITLSVRAL